MVTTGVKSTASKLLLLACILVLLAGCGGGNSSPKANFTVSPSTGTSPLSVYFDASASSDPDGTIARYEWDFGDGTGATGVTTVHTYEAPGRYLVRLTVTDERDATRSATERIAVAEAEEELSVGTEIGQIAPDFALADLHGQTRSLSAFRGHVVILSFWQTSCPSCAAITPKLVELYRDYENKGVVMAGVNLDYYVEATVSYLEENGYTDVITLWGSYDAAMGIVNLYNVPEVPYMFLIDRQGIIRFVGDEHHPLTEIVAESWL